MSKENKIKIVMNICFFLYFIVLLVERTISVVLSIQDRVLFINGFNIVVYLTILVSFIGFIVYLLLYEVLAVKALVQPKNIEQVDFKKMVILSGILLLSGMVHSEHTISIVQFISYGFFIIAIVLQGILIHPTCKNKALLWISIIYLIALSMAIPVTYQTQLSYHVAFHAASLITTYILVGVFTYLCVCLFNGKEDLFYPWAILVFLVLDAVVLGLKWQEEVNTFVLIFISVATIVFIPGILISKMNKKN